jgi:hypothetical protein
MMAARCSLTIAHAARVAPLRVSSRRRITRVSSRPRRISRAAESQAATEASDIEDVEENEEELAERKAVSELVGWCVSKGAQGSGLSVLLPDDSGRGRGLEASRDIEVGTSNAQVLGLKSVETVFIDPMTHHQPPLPSRNRTANRC